MNFISIFDVIGPNMIGPSSSHTAGAVSIALLARKLFPGEIVRVKFILYGSFAQTGAGHGTDKALLGGILGFETDDERIREAFEIADEKGLTYCFETGEDDAVGHPNTADIFMEGADGKRQSIRGESIGGGKVRIVRINDIDVDFTGEFSTLIVRQVDKPGVISHITQCLSRYHVNIAFMRLFRHDKGGIAYTVVEADDRIPEEVLKEIRENSYVHEITLIQV